ncbi:hypothetical protein C8T65DRAFT_745065 [Cerioporus squamosus]|nr:hypothetical protein C8T65DRAFT_745065 [Cerioporus squamosus]
MVYDFTIATKQNDGVAAIPRGTKFQFEASNGYQYVGRLTRVIESRSNYPIYRLTFADGTYCDRVKNSCTEVSSDTALSPSAPRG